MSHKRNCRGYSPINNMNSQEFIFQKERKEINNHETNSDSDQIDLEEHNENSLNKCSDTNNDDGISEKSSSSDKNKKGRRSRTVMTTYQSKLLHEFFEKNAFPSTEMREELSASLGMKPRTIQIWFQNQRQKTKSKKESVVIWEFRHRNGEYRSLNILANVAITMLIERKKELDKKH